MQGVPTMAKPQCMKNTRYAEIMVNLQTRHRCSGCWHTTITSVAKYAAPSTPMWQKGQLAR